MKLAARLLVAACSVVFTFPSAAATDATATAQRIERAYRALQEMPPVAGRELDGSALDRLASEIEREIAQLSRGGTPATPQWLKMRQVQALVANARLALAHLGRGQAHALPDAEMALTIEVHAGTGDAGSVCKLPWDLGVGQSLTTTLMPVGMRGEAFWLRVKSDATQPAMISTLGSRGDVDLAVFRDCDDATPLAYVDDVYGLQALLRMPHGPHGEFRVRVGSRDSMQPVIARIEGARAQGFSGRVYPEQAGVGITPTLVSYFSEISGYYLGTAYPDISGNYSAAVSTPGTYFARTGGGSSTVWLAHEAYRDIPCASDDYSFMGSCTPGQPEPIQVSSGQYTAGVDFALDLARALIVNLIDEASGAPLAGALVTLSRDNHPAHSTYTDATGRAIFRGLRANYDYRAKAQLDGYLGEAWDNIPCPSGNCSPEVGSPIRFLVGDPYVRGIDIALTPQRRLLVHIRDVSGANSNVSARLLYPSGQIAAQVQSTWNLIPGWRTATFIEPPVGNYYLQAGYPDATLWRLHPAVDCLDDCLARLADAATIQVTSAPGSQSVYVDPRPFPRVRGKMTEAGSGDPVAGGIAYLIPMSAAPTSTSQRVANAAGDYLYSFVRPGNYLIAAGSTRHVDVAYPQAPCTLVGANLICPNAVPVTIGSDQTEHVFDFQLEPSGQIGGSMRVEGAPLPTGISPSVQLWSSNGQSLTGIISRNGAGYTVADLAPGSYRVVAGPTNATHGQIYPALDCASIACNAPSVGEWVTVSPGTSASVDFDLRLARGAKGQVLDASTGMPLVGVVIDMWSDRFSSQYYEGSALSGTDGRFAIPSADIQAAAYWVATSIAGGYVNEVYRNVQCPLGPAQLGLCDVSQGAPVGPGFPLVAPGISIRLYRESASGIFEDGLEE